jgi:deoxyribodipyrimidine photo-lyase
MQTHIYWLRQDLRLTDNASLLKACNFANQSAQPLAVVYCHDTAQDEATRWGFQRMGPHRRQFLANALTDLAQQLQARGHALWLLRGRASVVISQLSRELSAHTVWCENIAAPDEQAEVAALRAAGLQVHTTWQSTLLEPAALPFASHALPQVFTVFRQQIEQKSVQPLAPLASPNQWPSAAPINTAPVGFTLHTPHSLLEIKAPREDKRSSFPYTKAQFSGGETAAQAHVQRYFGNPVLGNYLAHSYKTTRNRLTGTDYSTKFSPWLAQGSVSARQIFSALQVFERTRGATDSTYWIWFELLWRDYFRLLHLQHGKRLYAASGLSTLPAPTHCAVKFSRWCHGETGEPLVDAGLRELAATGYLSNRLRQVVASFLIHDLACDWRAGAAWFEAQLVDYDVYSNQGNWLYIAGRGTDPRQGRRFNPAKQARDHDANGSYQALWASA